METTSADNIIGKWGIDIVPSPHAVREIYRFKKSKHRSRRLYKKLTSRLGNQISMIPVAYMFGGRIFAHPSLIRQIRQDGFVMGARCD